MEKLQEIKQEISDSIKCKQNILEDSALLVQIHALSEAGLEALQNGGKIIFAGNGGSFADAQHLSAEFTSRYAFNRESLPSLALGCNSSAISAIGNDYGYDQVFSRELSSIGMNKDVYIPISTSGNSPNILASIDVAKKMGMKVCGFAGGTGGKMVELCDCIVVPSDATGRIQESHIMIGHIICGLIEKRYFAD
jgi:D-sedoheptulose 7-phosphate isomerase